jgi:hypothetical protein
MLVMVSAASACAASASNRPAMAGILTAILGLLLEGVLEHAHWDRGPTSFQQEFPRNQSKSGVCGKSLYHSSLSPFLSPTRDLLHARLAAVGLIEPRLNATATIFLSPGGGLGHFQVKRRQPVLLAGSRPCPARDRISHDEIEKDGVLAVAREPVPQACLDAI